ncbi:UNVERIFIED_ORG: hypothetical protein J2Y81_006179 [Paraburkholderia sediminicola]|nr:hypothetical protein [Paraburkholderia sediminicola]
MNLRIGRDLFLRGPTVRCVLQVRQARKFNSAPQLVSEYNVMSRDTGLTTKIVLVQMFVHAKKVGVSPSEVGSTKFLACDPVKGVVKALVLANATARDKPEALSGFVNAAPEKITAHLVLDDKVDGYQWCYIDDIQEHKGWKHGHSAENDREERCY